ncbi:MAG: hypothetical protein NTW94_01335 [Legionellales bacterium]|nr:hypothetical protein [Legionellales bacterium]
MVQFFSKSVSVAQKGLKMYMGMGAAGAVIASVAGVAAAGTPAEIRKLDETYAREIPAREQTQMRYAAFIAEKTAFAVGKAVVSGSFVVSYPATKCARAVEDALDHKDFKGLYFR